MNQKLYVFLYISLISLVFVSCSADRFIPEGSYMLDKVSVNLDEPALREAGLSGYLRQHSNSKWFSLAKVPMGIYLCQGKDSTKWFNKFLRKIGEAPVIYDSTQIYRTVDDMTRAVRGMGYVDAIVRLDKFIQRNKVSVRYSTSAGRRLFVYHLHFDFPDDNMRKVYESTRLQSFLRNGMPFDINILDKERSRIVTLFLNNGYYRFNRSHIHFLADTISTPGFVELTLQILPYRENSLAVTTPHPRFVFGEINFSEESRKTFRETVLRDACRMKKGDLYTETSTQQTYSRLARLGNVYNATAHFTQVDSSTINADIVVNTSRTHSLQLSPEATNTAGDFGAAIGLTYQNRNAFKGGETFSVKLRGAYEAVKGLDGYANNGFNEYSAEASLSFPKFKAPFVSSNLSNNSTAYTELGLMYDSQNRPEFHRRVLTASFRYLWSNYNRRMQHRFDLIDLNYIFMPWISETFRKDYLDDTSSRNSLLRYNYENLFIMKSGYTYSYTSRNIIKGSNVRRRSTYALRASVETSGNLLRAISALSHNRKHSDGYLHFMGIPYAQYTKVDFDFSRLTNIDERNQLALHAYVGVACPYGNSSILPFEKRYFSGGANSVRGWSVRELGPGRFHGSDGRIDFINQTGDIKLDMSIELRSHLFWKINGALFVDAGNIWTIRNYPEQPGGQFTINTFWKEIAAAYGIGLRFNFDYFAVRLDAGMKAVNPAYESTRKRLPIIYPKLSRDFALHFAVGLPF